MDSQARSIIEQLQEVVASLRGYAYDVWIGTDVSDNKAIARSVQFVNVLNDRLKTFAPAAQEILATIQQYAGVEVDSILSTELDDVATPSYSQAVMTTGDTQILSRRLKNFPLKGAYLGRVPFGFRLLSRSFHDLTGWSELHTMVLRQLAQFNPQTIYDLPDRKEALGSRRRNSDERRVYFNRSGEGLNRPVEVVHGVWADLGYDANATCGHIATLLEVFEIPDSEFELYLRKQGKCSGPVEAE